MICVVFCGCSNLIIAMFKDYVLRFSVDRFLLDSGGYVALPGAKASLSSYFCAQLVNAISVVCFGLRWYFLAEAVLRPSSLAGSENGCDSDFRELSCS